jgi:tetratricopeptide (TPR) repeat protein
LVDASTQNVLWSENYERKMNQLVSLESEIASNVSENLRLKLTNAEQVRVAKTYTTNSKAQRAYLKGRFHWNKRNKEDFEKAVEYFKQAIENDPNYALAYTGLADAYALLPLYGNYSPKEYKPQAKQAALRALDLDAELAEAHASLGYIINTYDFDWEGAEREYKTALQLNPNYATAHQWYAEHLAFKGRTDEALVEISKAVELDPFSVVINRMKGNILGFAGRYEEAIAQLKKTIDFYPENSFARYNLGEALAAKGMYSEAVGQYLIALKLDGQQPEDIEKFETAYKSRGWKGFWVEYLENLEKQRKTLLETDPTAYFNSEGIAYAYAATGNKDKALEYLGKAYDERDPSLVTIKTSEVYDFLGDDPRFKELIRNIGLPE